MQTYRRTEQNTDHTRRIHKKQFRNSFKFCITTKQQVVKEKFCKVIKIWFETWPNLDTNIYNKRMLPYFELTYKPSLIKPSKNAMVV